jgi:hypothetical protein
VSILILSITTSLTLACSTALSESNCVVEDDEFEQLQSKSTIKPNKTSTLSFIISKIQELHTQKKGTDIRPPF